MRIVHIISKPPADWVQYIITEHSKEHDVVTVMLAPGETDYEDLVNKILSGDRIFSWINIQDSTYG